LFSFKAIIPYILKTCTLYTSMSVLVNLSSGLKFILYILRYPFIPLSALQQVCSLFQSELWYILILFSVLYAAYKIIIFHICSIINPLQHSRYYMSSSFSSHSVFIFRMTLVTNTNYFPIQSAPTASYNDTSWCCLCGTK